LGLKWERFAKPFGASSRLVDSLVNMRLTCDDHLARPVVTETGQYLASCLATDGRLRLGAARIPRGYSIALEGQASWCAWIDERPATSARDC